MLFFHIYLGLEYTIGRFFFFNENEVFLFRRIIKGQRAGLTPILENKKEIQLIFIDAILKFHMLFLFLEQY